jgi:hypothetical protein
MTEQTPEKPVPLAFVEVLPDPTEDGRITVGSAVNGLPRTKFAAILRTLADQYDQDPATGSDPS